MLAIGCASCLRVTILGLLICAACTPSKPASSDGVQPSLESSSQDPLDGGSPAELIRRLGAGVATTRDVVRFGGLVASRDEALFANAQSLKSGIRAVFCGEYLAKMKGPDAVVFLALARDATSWSMNEVVALLDKQPLWRLRPDLAAAASRWLAVAEAAEALDCEDALGIVSGMSALSIREGRSLLMRRAESVAASYLLSCGAAATDVVCAGLDDAEELVRWQVCLASIDCLAMHSGEFASLAVQARKSKSAQARVIDFCLTGDAAILTDDARKILRGRYADVAIEAIAALKAGALGGDIRMRLEHSMIDVIGQDPIELLGDLEGHSENLLALQILALACSRAGLAGRPLLVKAAECKLLAGVW